MGKNKSLLQRLKDERWLQLMALAGLIWMLVFNYAPMYNGRKWVGRRKHRGLDNHPHQQKVQGQALMSIPMRFMTDLPHGNQFSQT